MGIVLPCALQDRQNADILALRRTLIAKPGHTGLFSEYRQDIEDTGRGRSSRQGDAERLCDGAEF